MTQTNEKVYPITAQAERTLRDFVKQESALTRSFVKGLANDALTYIGEMEHDPSLAFPEDWDDIAPGGDDDYGLSDEEFDARMAQTNAKVRIAADAIVDFVRYYAASGTSEPEVDWDEEERLEEQEAEEARKGRDF